MKRQFRIDLLFYVETLPYQFNAPIAQQHTIVTDTIKKCLTKTVRLIEDAIKTTIKNGNNSCVPEKIRFFELNEYGVPVRLLCTWKYRNVHLPCYNEAGFKEYFEFFLKLYSPFRTKQMQSSEKGVVPLITVPGNSVLWTDEEDGTEEIEERRKVFTKAEIKRLATMQLKPEHQVYKLLVLLMYYLQVHERDLGGIEEKDIVDQCLILKTKSGIARVLPLHPVVEQALKQFLELRHHMQLNQKELYKLLSNLASYARSETMILIAPGPFLGYDSTTPNNIRKCGLHIMKQSGFLKEDIQLLKGELLKSPEECATYKKALDNLFRSKFFIESI